MLLSVHPGQRTSHHPVHTEPEEEADTSPTRPHTDIPRAVPILILPPLNPLQGAPHSGQQGPTLKVHLPLAPLMEQREPFARLLGFPGLQDSLSQSLTSSALSSLSWLLSRELSAVGVSSSLAS